MFAGGGVSLCGPYCRSEHNGNTSTNSNTTSNTSTSSNTNTTTTNNNDDNNNNTSIAALSRGCPAELAGAGRLRRFVAIVTH